MWKSDTLSIHAQAMAEEHKSPLLQVQNTGKLHYYALRIAPPAAQLKWCQENIPQQSVKKATQAENSHITLIYGIDPEQYPTVHRRVMDMCLTEADLQFGEVYFVQPSHTESYGEAYFCVDINSDKLTKLKRSLCAEFKPDVTATDHEVPPHLTLCATKRVPNASKESFNLPIEEAIQRLGALKM